MKYKGILSLLSFLLILPIHYAHSQNVDELFGIKLLDNATNYVSSEYAEKNKVKNMETLSGFWDLYISDKVSSPYFDNFFITMDDYNIIYLVQGDRDYSSEDRCVTFLDKLVEKKETQKQIKFKLDEEDYGKFKTKRYIFWTNDIVTVIQCNHYFDSNKDAMIYTIRSKPLNDAINKYYSSD